MAVGFKGRMVLEAGLGECGFECGYSKAPFVLY